MTTTIVIQNLSNTVFIVESYFENKTNLRVLTILSINNYVVLLSDFYLLPIILFIINPDKLLAKSKGLEKTFVK